MDVNHGLGRGLARREFLRKMLPAGMVLTLPALAWAQTEPPRHRVGIAKFLYVPALLTIKVGDVVEWFNQDLVPHTATFRGGGTAPAWDSGRLSRDGTASFTFTEPGRIDYYCRFHPHMVGTIIVE